MATSSEYSAAPEGEMQFSVLLFAGLRDAMKRDEITVVLPRRGSTPTVGDLLAACAAQFPPLAAWLPHIRVAVNCEYSEAATPLHDGDEIAFIPPVAGG